MTSTAAGHRPSNRAPVTHPSNGQASGSGVSTVRFRHLIIGLGAVLGLLVLAAPPAAADVNDAISSLQSGNNLYVDGSANATLDRASANAALSSSVKIAVLPAGAGNAGQLAIQIGQAIGGNVTVGVFVGHTFNAGSNVLCKGQAGSLASKAVSDNSAQLKSNNDLTNTIKDFASLVGSSGTCSSGGGANGNGSNGNGSNGNGDLGKSHGSSNGGWIALGVLGVLGAGGVGGLVAWRRRRDKLALIDARARVQPYYDRLAVEVSSLQPMGNRTAEQALADASERFNAAGSQLSGATRPAQLEAARRSTLEGLQAIQTARKALGLDPGPDLPPMVETQSPQLTEPQQVNAGGQTVQGYPTYTPGAPYYFAGGGGYAGGWYSSPFWQGLLIAEVLSPGWGWGGGWGGGGYGSGYDSGFNSGYDAGQDSVQQDNGGWGGGDWGGGGGDWGGGGGGGGGGGDGGGGSW